MGSKPGWTGPPAAGLRNPALSQLMLAPEHVTAALDRAGWSVVVAHAATRKQAIEGVPTTVTDTVVRAVRAGLITGSHPPAVAGPP